VTLSQLLGPAGTHIQVNDRPLGISLSPDGRTLAVAPGSNFNPNALHLINVVSKTLVQMIPLQSSFVGVPVLKKKADGTFAQTSSFTIAGSAPSGLSPSPDEKTLYVALNLKHTPGVIDVSSGTAPPTLSR
jgi:DNA-binding beta-propeller fold protein YncE